MSTAQGAASPAAVEKTLEDAALPRPCKGAAPRWLTILISVLFQLLFLEIVLILQQRLDLSKDLQLFQLVEGADFLQVVVQRARKDLVGIFGLAIEKW